jgi:uncharacterized protein (TIGR00369 family)
MSNESENPRIALLRKAIGMGPDIWPIPIPKMLRMELLEVSEGEALVKTTVKNEWLNPLGIMHGGYLVMIMDEMMGLAGYTLNHPHGYATINLTADFLRSAREGDVLLAKGKIIRKGMQIIHAESVIENAKGDIVSKSTSNLLAISNKS